MADQFQTQSAQPLNLNVTSAPQVAVEPAGFWRRFAASFIDGIVLAVIQMPVKAPLTYFQYKDQTAAGTVMVYILSFLVSGFVMFFYFGYFYSKKGATPGKMVMDLRVLREDTGTHLSYWLSFGREFIGKSVLDVATLGIGYLIAAFREDKKALHDLVFGTRVVRVRK